MQVIDPDPLLGEALDHFPSNRLRPLITAGVVIAPVALLLGLTTAQVEAWWGPLVTVVGVALVVLVAGWYVLHGWNREIILYERGFSYREGSQTIFMRYDEIAAVRLRAERLAYFGGRLHRDVYRFRVTTTEGERFTITNLYQRADVLGTLLTEQVNRVLHGEIAGRLSEGQAVAFGDTLRISGAGLQDGGRSLAWEQYGGYRIGGRRLTIYEAAGGGVWLALPLWEADNVVLLLALLREKQGKKGSSA